MVGGHDAWRATAGPIEARGVDLAAVAALYSAVEPRLEERVDAGLISALGRLCDALRI